MPRTSLDDLNAFAAVAHERSFTRAAARLGVSQSALSHTLRVLEERLGVRLLTRTTRSVTPTEAGERLLRTVAPRLEEIKAELASLAELRDRPAGTIRITTSRQAAETILWPALAPVLRDYPDIKLELSLDQSLTDIVAARYDAGVRLGEQVARDMIAVRIGPDMQMAVVGSPGYLAGRHAAGTGGAKPWVILPFKPDPKIRFDYEMSMGVRFGEKEWQNTLDAWIGAHQGQIDQILGAHHVPLLNASGEIVNVKN